MMGEKADGGTQIILETERLYLREIIRSDFPALCCVLQDAEVMCAYEHAFNDTEVWEWLYKQQERYRKDGFGLWAAVLKESEAVIGQCGLTTQGWKGLKVPEIGYLFEKNHWHRGYATEAAIACKKYAFRDLNAEEVFSFIRDSNIPSQNVAKRNGMEMRGQIVKRDRYRVSRLIFSAKKRDMQPTPWNNLPPLL